MLIFVAVLYPLLAFILALRKHDFRNLRIGSFAIAIMVAVAMPIVATSNFDADITRNLAQAASYVNVPWSDIFHERDWFIGLSAKLLGNISTDLRFLAVAYMLIHVALVLKCIKIIADNIAVPLENVSLFSILTLLLVSPFFDINSLRFTIATFFFIWCLLEAYLNKKNLFYGLMFISPFIHYGFWIMMPLPILYLLLKDRTILVVIVFVLSFAYSTASTSIALNNWVSRHMSESVAKSVDGYASESNLEGMEAYYAEGARMGNTKRAIQRFSVEFRNYAIMTSVFILALLNINDKKKKGINGQENKRLTYSLNMMLLMYSCANIACSNSQGDRFYLVCAIFVVFVTVWLKYNDDEWLLSFYVKRKKVFDFILVVALVVSILFIYTGRNAFNLLGVILGNYFMYL